MTRRITLLLLFSFLFTAYLSAQPNPRYIDPKDHSVLISAEVSEAPPQIKLSWMDDGLTESYEISKRAAGDIQWGQPIATLTNEALEYTDTDVEIGKAYEYRIMALRRASVILTFQGPDGNYDSTVAVNFLASGYLFSAIGLPAEAYKGIMLLVVDETLKDDLSQELSQFSADLFSEGWTVEMIEAPRAESFDAEKVKTTKDLIRNAYESNPENVKGAALIGRIPVPYSGNIVPDGHSNNHTGAWPADIYYAAPDESFWTDMTVNNPKGPREETKNIPGDGKFDQSTIIDGIVKLQVGRIDFYNMPLFEDDELTLLKKYFAKNHAYRAGLAKFEDKALVDDNFGSRKYLEGFASSGWRNFGSFYGEKNVAKEDFFTTLKDNNYMWAYGTGGGTYTSAGGVGNSADFKENQSNAVFTMLFGSYFGDWDYKDAFMRSALASEPSILTCAWAGRPPWFLHHMALGKNIGFSAVLSQENYTDYISNAYYLQGTNPSIQASGLRMIHTALLGDPTLTMYLGRAPSPTDLAIEQPPDSPIILSWKAPSGDILGYNIYRAYEKGGNYQKINNEIITETTFSDYGLIDGMLHYQVRAVKLEKTNSGSFYNLSGGIYGEIEAQNTLPPIAPKLEYPKKNAEDIPNLIELKWENLGPGVTYNLQIAKDEAFANVIVLETGLEENKFTAHLEPETQYFWKLKAANKNGEGKSSEVWAFTTAPQMIPPILETPGNGSKDITIPVYFKWKKVENADYYNLQIAKDDMFTEKSIVFEEKELLSSLTVVSENLSEKTTYYWRVQSFGANGLSEWPQPFSFTTFDDPNSVFDYDDDNEFRLWHFPQPAREFAYINFHLEEYGPVTLEVFDMNGQKVSEIVNRELPGGQHQFKFERKNLPSGAYFYRIISGGKMRAMKLILK